MHQGCMHWCLNGKHTPLQQNHPHPQKDGPSSLAFLLMWFRHDQCWRCLWVDVGIYVFVAAVLYNDIFPCELAWSCRPDVGLQTVRWILDFYYFQIHTRGHTYASAGNLSSHVFPRLRAQSGSYFLFRFCAPQLHSWTVTMKYCWGGVAITTRHTDKFQAANSSVATV